MSKLLTTLNKLEDYPLFNPFVDGFILGIRNFSVNYPNTYSMEKLKEVISKMKEDGKEVFLSLNKNMHKKDLEELETLLKEIETYHVNGILYYDVALVELMDKFHLSTPLVWAQEHLVTNYSTINYWESFGASYAFLSGEITLEEMKVIRENTDVKLIVPIFGRIPMFASKRHLVKNYFSYFHLPYEEASYTIRKEGNVIPIVDDALGTTVYSMHFLNGLKEMTMLKDMDYFYLNPYGIESKDMKVILEHYKNVEENNVETYEKEINELLEGNVDKGFLYKETIYKVKV